MTRKQTKLIKHKKLAQLMLQNHSCKTCAYLFEGKDNVCSMYRRRRKVKFYTDDRCVCENWLNNSIWGTKRWPQRGIGDPWKTPVGMTRGKTAVLYIERS